VRGCGTGAHTRRAPQALALAEGKLRGDVGGRWHVHHHPHATAGADAAEERALALAEGKLHGDVGGRWHVHHHPHATRGRDAAEERALALAEGEVHGDVGGRWHVHQHPHSIAGSDEHEKRALALAEGKVHPHPYGRAHAAARNGAAEERALRLAEGKEGASARKSIAAGHATGHCQARGGACDHPDQVGPPEVRVLPRPRALSLTYTSHALPFATPRPLLPPAPASSMSSGRV